MQNPIDRWFETKNFHPLRDMSEVEESLENLFYDFIMILPRKNGHGFMRPIDV